MILAILNDCRDSDYEPESTWDFTGDSRKAIQFFLEGEKSSFVK